MTPMLCFEPVGYQLQGSAVILEGCLRCEYRLSGDWQGVVWPGRSHSPGAQDGLYLTTCFEAFLGLEGTSYLEVNASPSGDWQYYWFADYRTKGVAKNLSAPKIETLANGVVVEVPLGTLRAGDIHCIGLTAVIEYPERKDYWALRHCGDKPDFHLRDSFIIKV